MRAPKCRASGSAKRIALRERSVKSTGTRICRTTNRCRPAAAADLARPAGRPARARRFPFPRNAVVGFFAFTVLNHSRPRPPAAPHAFCITHVISCPTRPGPTRGGVAPARPRGANAGRIISRIGPGDLTGERPEPLDEHGLALIRIRDRFGIAPMTDAAFYDAKPYDRDYFEDRAAAPRVRWRFHDFRLNADTAPTARGARVVCVFVNDRLDRACLDRK